MLAADTFPVTPRLVFDDGGSGGGSHPGCGLSGPALLALVSLSGGWPLRNVRGAWLGPSGSPVPAWQSRPVWDSGFSGESPREAGTSRVPRLLGRPGTPRGLCPPVLSLRLSPHLALFKHPQSLGDCGSPQPFGFEGERRKPSS